MKFPINLSSKLESRKQNHAFRQLNVPRGLIDFSSNDYLGFSRSTTIFEQTHEFLNTNNIVQNGATGSRLLTGNHQLYPIAEALIANLHECEDALVFNSGYDANLGFFSSVPQKGDVILFDELCHASIRDGIALSHAKAYKFEHNNMDDLERLLGKHPQESRLQQQNQIYIVTESVFSMDGDLADLAGLVNIADKNGCLLVVDEAHALGVFGDNGLGLVQQLKLQDKVFARIFTFGKSLGCHGAAIVGSRKLKDYLVNFARSFIYTTGLSPHSVAVIITAYDHLNKDSSEIQKLRANISFFNQQKSLLSLKPLFVRSKSAIHSAIIPGNERVRRISGHLQEQGFDVKAILSPTVPEGQERLRFCLHSYNTENEMREILELLGNFVI